jgi:galactokinase
LVLPMAIDLETVIAVRPRGDGRIVLRSLDQAEHEQVVELAAGGPAAADVEPAWGRYPAAVAAELRGLAAAPLGADAVLASNVPLGSGLSSSASLELACAVGLAAAAELALHPVELAFACQRAEQAATGVPSGIMDQYTSAAGRAGHALLLDCRSLEVDPIPLPAGVEVLAVHSGIERTLEGSAYTERQRACARAAERLGLAALRDASPEQVADDPLARHVVSEIQRVRDAAAALRGGDLERLGALLAESHASLRDDFGVSTPELDTLVDVLVGSGAAGARLTGAGFGGAVVALAQRNHADDVLAKTTLRYRAATGLEPMAFVARAVDGARVV